MCFLGTGKDIEVPKIASKKPKAFKTFTGELTTLPNADVIVKPSGKVIVKRTNNEENEVSNDVKKVNTDHVDELDKFGNKETIEKSKPEKSTELHKYKQNKNSNKKVNMVLKIESGKIEEEIVLDGLQLGDQVKKRKVKTDGVKGLKLKLNSSKFKSQGNKIKKQRMNQND